MFKTSLKLLSLGLACAFSPLSYSSTGAGNGGDALICHNSPDYGDQVILLDTHEARKRRLTLDLGPELEDHKSMINVAVKRLMEKDIVTAEKLYAYAMEMVADIEMLEQFPNSRGKVLYIGHDVVGEINDSLHVTIPIGCEIRQLVSQKAPKYRFDYRYEINKAIWDQMSKFEQSMTILHEAWYRIMIENDSSDNHNSYGARYMNGLVASKEFESYSFEDYIRDLRQTELKKYTLINNSSALIGKEISFDISGDLSFEQGNACVPDVKIPAQLKRFGIRGLFNGITTLDVAFTKACFKNSRMASLELPQAVSSKGFLLSMEQFQISVQGEGSEPALMQFHPNGTLSQVTNVYTEFLLRFYYDCDGEIRLKPGKNCRGPYRNNDTRIDNPGEVKFSSEDEFPIGHGFRASEQIRPAEQIEPSEQAQGRTKKKSGAFQNQKKAVNKYLPTRQQHQQQQEQQQQQRSLFTKK